MNSFAVSAASQVTCLHFHTSPTRRIYFLLLYCWEKWTRACWWPHRIVHCGSCSVKCTGALLAKDSSPSDHICCMEAHPSAFVRRIPTATGHKFLSFTSKWTLYCWVRWPTSLPCWGHGCAGQEALKKPVELSCAGATHEQWCCSGWSSCPVFDISWASRASLHGWGADQVCALLSWATAPGAHEEMMFWRPERSSQCWMLFWSSFKFMGDFFTLYPQKS